MTTGSCLVAGITFRRVSANPGENGRDVCKSVCCEVILSLKPSSSYPVVSQRAYTYCVGRAADSGYFSNKDCAGVILFGAEKCTQVLSGSNYFRKSETVSRFAWMQSRSWEEMATSMTIPLADSFGRFISSLHPMFNLYLQGRKAL